MPANAIDYVIVTAPRESVEEVRDLVKTAGFKKSVIVIEGGERRQDFGRDGTSAP